MKYDNIQYDADKRELEGNKVSIKLLSREVELLKGMLNDALDYGLKKNQENTRLLRRIKGLM